MGQHDARGAGRHHACRCSGKGVILVRSGLESLKPDRMVIARLWLGVALLLCLTACANWGGERSAGQIAEDSAIVAAVKARFIADRYVGASSVNVDVYEGVVTLTGDVLSFVERDQAERIAQAVRGVVKVENKLTVVK